MSYLTLPTAIILLFATLLLKHLYTYLTTPLRHLPGPHHTRFTHLPLKFAVISGTRLHHIHALHTHYGPIVRISPTEASIASLDSTTKIHRVNSGFLKTAWYLKFSESPGVFAMTDPHAHAVRRKLFAQPFSKSALRAVWEGTVAEKVGAAIDGIRGEVERDGEADMMKWWTFMATDVSGELMFGESFDMLSTGHKTEYIEVLEKTMMGAGIGVELPLVRVLGRVLPIRALRTLFDGNAFLRAYGERAVRNAKAASGGRGNIFSNAVAEAEKSDGKLTEGDVRLEASNLIVAGSDTTAVTMTYLVWAVCGDAKLRGELEDEVAVLGDEFTDADLEGLELCNATIDEALRLYGAAPGSLPRAVPKGGTTLDGYFVPEGITVSTQAWTLHRDPSIFENPESFDPHRWLSKNPRVETAKVAMSPFGKGSRTCLGVHLARMELRYGLALFLRRCKDLKLGPTVTAESMAVENFFLIAPKSHECIVIKK